jgi:hypothetical protein
MDSPKIDFAFIDQHGPSDCGVLALMHIRFTANKKVMQVAAHVALIT